MFSQVVINILIRGSQLALLSVGVTMIFSILRFANFAHGEFALIGAYIALFFCATLGFNLYLSIVIALLLTGFLGLFLNEIMFKKLRVGGGITMMIGSLGLSIFLRHMVQGIWGPDPLSYPLGVGRRFDIFGALITSSQLVVVGISILSVFGFHFLLQKTKLGKAMRAVSDNIVLAKASGMNVERVIAGVWFIGSSFAAIGGVSVGMETVLWPEMGFSILLPVFAAAVLGGIGNPYGAILGALILATAENLGLFLDWGSIFNLGGLIHIFLHLYIPTGYKLAISFLLLILVLVIRPAGLLRGTRGD